MKQVVDIKKNIKNYREKFTFNYIIIFLKKTDVNFSLKKAVLELSLIQIALSIILFLLNNKFNLEYTKFLIIYKVDFLNIILGYDIISILFIILTSFIFFISILLN